ncbi:hypothetical protein PPMP20_28170 [Paraburkholderia phymatum]|uniref:Uncharacterized protein n=1 Tax=Paraburkholderia phymatum (strain DSM 17167 / CIP 108236 / LMG 21445 / STM815) TaxID=391038 RepID=B2JNM5_PARP8|nr:hypothetical protein [Paraburkholderia phymatum]ACC72976.1 conserved hypothetical protein [Paraburkholderia phymatum STM815]
MSSIMIRDIDGERTLGRHEMSAVSGGTGTPGLTGNSWLAGLGPVANVNIGINQNITQAQFINVETLNNSIVGPGVKLPNINLSPKLVANTNAVV